MPERETHRSLPELWKYFDPSKFGNGDLIVYNDPVTHKWKKGVLGSRVPAIDRDSRRVFLRQQEVSSGQRSGSLPIKEIELEIPPKLVDQYLLERNYYLRLEDNKGVHSKIKYQVKRDPTNHGAPLWEVGPNGEIEVDLYPTESGTNHEVLRNVNLDFLRGVAEVERVEEDIDTGLNAVRREIKKIHDVRVKKIWEKIVALDKRLHALIGKTGHFDEWGDVDTATVKAITKNITETRRQAEIEFRVIESETQQLLELMTTPEVDNTKNTVDQTAPEIFDFEKEKAELTAKFEALYTKNNELKELNPSLDGKDFVQHLSSLNALTATTKNCQQVLANLWSQAADLEIGLFKEEQRLTGRSETNKEIDVDLPPNLLMDLLRQRGEAIKAVWRHAYNLEMDGQGNESVVEALRQIFEPAVTQTMPRQHDQWGGLGVDEQMIARLRQYGIKDWRHFKKLWDEKLAPKAAEFVQMIAQDDVRNEIARHASSWDNIKALKWQVGTRILTNMALVGGATIGVSALLATGGLAGIGLAAAGGAAAGGVRAGLQKFIFGSNWMEERKRKKLEELSVRQREKTVNSLLGSRFSTRSPGALQEKTLAMFSSLLATAARVASKQFVNDAEAKAEGLSGDAERLYIQAMEDMRLGGDVPSAEQKQKCALAIRRLMTPVTANTPQGAHGDPVGIRLFDGVMQGYSGTQVNNKKYGLVQAGATVALGAGAGVAFFADNWWARGVMGGVGGALSAYHWGEGRRRRAERELAQKETKANIENTRSDLFSVLADLENKTPPDSAIVGSLTTNVELLNRLLRGNCKSVAEQRQAQILVEEKNLRAQAEDLVYQTYRRGIFALRALGNLEDSARRISDTRGAIAGRAKELWSKFFARAGYVTGGAIAGAGLAVLVGHGIQGLKEWFGIGVTPTDTGRAPVPVQKGPTPPVHPPAPAPAPIKQPSPIPTPVPQPAPSPSPAPIEVRPTIPPPVEQSLDVVSVGRNKGILHAVNILQNKHAEVFGNMSKQDLHDWRVAELKNMGFQFQDGKWGYPVGVRAGAQIELFKDPTGKPHFRFAGDNGVVKYNQPKWVDVIDKPKDSTTAASISADTKTPTPSAREFAEAAARDLNTGGASVISDLPVDIENRFGANMRITHAQAVGDAGLVAVTLNNGESHLVMPIKDENNIWHIHSADDTFVPPASNRVAEQSRGAISASAESAPDNSIPAKITGRTLDERLFSARDVIATSPAYNPAQKTALANYQWLLNMREGVWGARGEGLRALAARTPGLSEHIRHPKIREQLDLLIKNHQKAVHDFVDNLTKARPYEKIAPKLVGVLSHEDLPLDQVIDPSAPNNAAFFEAVDKRGMAQVITPVLQAIEVEGSTASFDDDF